jgi:hypothetical protein
MAGREMEQFVIKDAKMCARLDWDLVGNLLFLGASVIYVISAVLLYFKNMNELANHINLAGSLVFTVNAVVSIAAWCDVRYVRLRYSRFQRVLHEHREFLEST